MSAKILENGDFSIFQRAVTRGVKAVSKISVFVPVTIHLESSEMAQASTTDNAPKLDRAKVRKFREIARYRLDDCVRESNLQEDWRRIERGEFSEVGRDVVYDIADFLGCDVDDLLTEKCPAFRLPETFSLCDSENWVYSSESSSGLRVKVEPKGGQSLLRINCEDATPEEMESFWKMLTSRVTS
jgi:hypothetical protein